MKSEAEIRERLENRKQHLKNTLENRMYWAHEDIQQEIKTLEWVMS